MSISHLSSPNCSPGVWRKLGPLRQSWNFLLLEYFLPTTSLLWKDHVVPGKREGKGFWLWSLLKLLVIWAPRVLRRLVTPQAPCYERCKGILAKAASPRRSVQPPWTPCAIRHFPEGPDSFIGTEHPPQFGGLSFACCSPSVSDPKETEF